MLAEAEIINPPPIPEPTPAPPAFDIEELGKKDRRWRLEIRQADLALFEGNDPHPYIILRDHFCTDRLFFDDHIKALVLKKPKKVTLKLTPEATKALADWIGESILAGLCLKRRYAWVLPVAIVWLLGSLPISGNPDAGIQARGVDLPGLGMGLVLVITWALAKWRPNGILFLVDSVWFLCLSAYIGWDVVNGRSKFWLIFVAWALWMVVSGIRYFARFRNTQVTRIP